MARKYFGTDGVRGTVGEFPITPDFVLKLGWAAGKVLAAHGGSKILIGKDTRISGYMFESALEAGISAAGVDVRLLGPLPTPGIAYLTSDAALTSPFVSSFRVREELPADTKKLARALRERNIGTLEIKKRGVDVDPAVLRTRLSLRGDESATLLITRVAGRRVALLADRVG